jgi:pilus assembly protein CpaF
MTYMFNPMEYVETQADLLVRESVAELSGSDRLYEVVTQARDYLRDSQRHNFVRSVIDPKVREMLKTEVTHYLTSRPNLHIPGVSLKQLVDAVQQEILYFGPIQKALDDPSVTNIDINAPKDVYIERNGEEEYCPDMAFKDDIHLETMINRMLIADGKTLTANEPHIDSLFEKYRICAVLGTSRGGIATEGTCVSIRKFSDETITPKDLIRMGSISEEMDQFFAHVIPCCNAIVAGATNSGKTTTLMALPLYFNEDTRIITIEDSPEMMLRRKKAFQHYRNIVALQTKAHDNKDKSYDIARLTKVSLRMRPFKILIGEVRDSQACRQAQAAMNTGHGTYMTIHASSAKNAAVRIVQLAGDGYNDETIAAQLADTVDLILFQQKIKKSRVITSVIELVGYEQARRPVCRNLFRFVQTGVDENGFAEGYHERLEGISEELALKLEINMIPKDIIESYVHVKENDVR